MKKGKGKKPAKKSKADYEKRKFMIDIIGIMIAIAGIIIIVYFATRKARAIAPPPNGNGVTPGSAPAIVFSSTTPHYTEGDVYHIVPEDKITNNNRGVNEFDEFFPGTYLGDPVYGPLVGNEAPFMAGLKDGRLAVWSSVNMPTPFEWVTNQYYYFLIWGP